MALNRNDSEFKEKTVKNMLTRISEPIVATGKKE